MATTSSLGIGTGVDLQSMLSKLMTAERSPIVTLDARISATNSKISIYGTLKSKLDALKTAADTLALPTKLSAMSATSSETTVLSSTAAFNATAATYAIDVTQLAKAQKSVSGAFTAGTTFGEGSLSITVNGTPNTIDLHGQGTYTLQDIRGKINQANMGVTASVVSGTNGDQIVLTSTKTGAVGAFSVGISADATAATSLNGLTGLTTAVPIDTLRAKLTIDDIDVESDTNSLTTAIEGLTINLQKQGTTTLTVQGDSTKIVSAVQAFVDSYNAVTAMIKVNSAYDISTKVAQPLNGDSTARSIVSTLANTRNTVPGELSSAAIKTLGELGISVLQTGALSLDTTVLNKAISTSTENVTKALNAYGKSFSDTIAGALGSGGLIANRTDALDATIRSYQDRREALEIRVANIEKRYRAQFTSLDKFVSSMQTTSGYLTQQLANL